MEQELDRLNLSSTNQKALYYPLADHSCIEMPVRGKYPLGHPVGAVIHYTAGRSKGDKDAINTIAYGAKQGYCYFTISSTGTVFQPMPLDSWGYHAGKSSWPGLGQWLSNRLVGIEVCCAGTVVETSIPLKYRSWFGESFYRVRSYTEDLENIKKGHYHKFTKPQELSLTQLLLWFKRNNPDVFSFDNVVGHDEISSDRKSDPGGSLSMPMFAYREHLKWQLMDIV